MKKQMSANDPFTILTSTRVPLEEMLRKAYFRVTTSGRPTLTDDCSERIYRAVEESLTVVTWRALSKYVPTALWGHCDDMRALDFKSVLEFCLARWAERRPKVRRAIFSDNVSLEFDVPALYYGHRRRGGS